MGRAGEWKVFCAIWRERNIKPPLSKGGAEHSEAEGFQPPAASTSLLQGRLFLPKIPP